jgi:Cu2+-exporting ATPase
MDRVTHEVHGQEAYPHGDHKMPMPHGNHDRYAGHSFAVFRDKFWLSFSLTIPVVFWSMDVNTGLGAQRLPSPV